MSLIDDIRKDRETGERTTSLAEAQRMIERRDTALLAADALVETLKRSDSWFEIDMALDAYSAAIGAS